MRKINITFALSLLILHIITTDLFSTTQTSTTTTPTAAPISTTLCGQKGILCSYIITTLVGGSSVEKLPAPPYDIAIDIINNNIFIANNTDLRQYNATTGAYIKTIATGTITSVDVGIAHTVWGADSGGWSGIRSSAPSAYSDNMPLSATDTSNGQNKNIRSLGIVKKTNGDIYFSDDASHTIKKHVKSSKAYSVIGGTLNTAGYDNTPTSSKFNQPEGIAIDSAGNLYIADANNHVIRKMTPSGSGYTFSTVAGTSGTNGFSGDGGLATNAKLNTPCGVAVDSQGNIYIADTGNHVIRFVAVETQNISTIAGTPNIAGYSGDNDIATKATLKYPINVKIDANNNIYIVDNQNSCIRKLVHALTTSY
jgi:sugar lactone lactonase YvrE